VKPIVLRNNRWRCDHGWDVDLDDGSSNYEIYNNLFLRGGLKLREGFHRRVWNNITVNNSLNPHVWYENSGDVVTNNIWMGAYRPAAMSGSLKKWGQEVDRNLFTTSDADRTKFAGKGCDAHSLVGDPMFVNPAQGDFRVKDGSPALKLGFRNFPMDQFGVRKPELKKIARTPEIPPVNLRPSTVIPEDSTCSWRDATIRNLAGQEFSAVGVAVDQGGAYFVNVPENSDAYQAGVRPNDLVTAIGKSPIRSVRHFSDLLAKSAADQPMEITVIRNQSSRSLKISPPHSVPAKN